MHDASGEGPKTVLPAVDRVPDLAYPSYLYLSSEQDEAEADAVVGTVIVDVVLESVTSGAVSEDLIEGRDRGVLAQCCRTRPFSRIDTPLTPSLDGPWRSDG